MEVTAIILAGGKSRRMGTDKALLEVEGSTMLSRAIELCKKVTSAIIISSNNQKHHEFGFPVVVDEFLDCGPMGGIAACLKVSKTQWNLVLSVDSAFVKSEFLSFLLSETSNFDAVVPYSKQGKEPLIALYNKTALPYLEENLTAGNYRVNHLLNNINTRWVDAQKWVEKYPKIFCNLNHPEDL